MLASRYPDWGGHWNGGWLQRFYLILAKQEAKITRNDMRAAVIGIALALMMAVAVVPAKSRLLSLHRRLRSGISIPVAMIPHEHTNGCGLAATARNEQYYVLRKGDRASLQ